MSNHLHLAGQKIRAWREARELSAADFGALVGELTGRPALPDQSVYNWEIRGKVARPPIQRALQQHGVCAAGDWLELVAGPCAAKDLAEVNHR